MGSHSVTFHPTQLNATRLNPSQAGRYSIHPPRGTEGWVDVGDWWDVMRVCGSMVSGAVRLTCSVARRTSVCSSRWLACAVPSSVAVSRRCRRPWLSVASRYTSTPSHWLLVMEPTTSVWSKAGIVIQFQLQDWFCLTVAWWWWWWWL